MKKIKEIAKSIYNEIQVMIEEEKRWIYLIFKFKDGEFISYFFSSDLYYSNDDNVYGGFLMPEDYRDIRIEDIEEELLYAQSNQCDKNTFDRLVELAKDELERETVKLSIRYQNIPLPVSWIPKNGSEILLALNDWYNNIMLAAGYSQQAIERNNRKCYNYEHYKLAEVIGDWYKTEIYPKICEDYPKEIKIKRTRRCKNQI